MIPFWTLVPALVGSILTLVTAARHTYISQWTIDGQATYFYALRCSYDDEHKLY